MRVLFVLSRTLIGADLACRIQNEGHEVRVFVDDKLQNGCLNGMVEKTKGWKMELDWVGKEGLIVFDDVGYGKIQAQLRKKGYSVVGGSAGGDLLEEKRGHGQKIFALCGMKVAESRSFDDAHQAIRYVEKNPGKWVIKQDGHLCTLNYVGQMDDGRDIISVLMRYAKDGIKPIELQKRVEGVEVAVGRYFNGTEWVGPVNVNFEHKPLFNGNIGPMTGEMGTLMWYEEAKHSVFFKRILSRMTEYLRQVSFRGYADVNCIINKDGAWPLEATMRFGCPIVHLQTTLQISPWAEVLKAVADGEKYDLKYNANYGIVVTVAVPPFPFFSYDLPSKEHSSEGASIFFKEDLSPEEMERIFFQQVRFDGKEYRISGVTGEVLYVTGVGKTVRAARKNAYALIDKLVIAKMFYRTDIGEKFLKNDRKMLSDLGWL